jgi:hypothetical protein
MAFTRFAVCLFAMFLDLAGSIDPARRITNRSDRLDVDQGCLPDPGISYRTWTKGINRKIW